MIRWRSTEIMITMIRKFKMFVNILMILGITERGRWESRMFTLCVSTKTDEKSSGCSMNNLSSPLSNDVLTSSEFCEWLEVDSSVDGFTQGKSDITNSPTMSRKSRGDTDRRKSSFTMGSFSDAQSYSSWMTMQVDCATSTSSMAWSSFTIGAESRIEEHKIVQSGGLVKHRDGGWGNKCVWKLTGFPTKSM